MASVRPVVMIKHDFKSISRNLNAKLHLNTRPEDISNPTAELAQNVYMNFVRLILNVPDHSLSILPINSNVDYDPDQHRNSVRLIIVYQCMKAFVTDHSGRAFDLSMCDLVLPGKIPGRFQKLMSFLVDFMKLYQLAKPIFSEISEEFSYRKQEVEELKQALYEEEKRKKEMLAQQSLRRRREHELIDEHAKVTHELNGIVQQYTASTTRATELEKQKEEAIQSIERLESETLSGKKMVEHLNEEFLASPEELKREMAERKKQIEELTECRNSSKQAHAAKLAALEICRHIEKNFPASAEKIKIFRNVRAEILKLFDAVNENLRQLTDLEQELKFTTEKTKKSHEMMEEQAEMHKQLRNEHLQRSRELDSRIEEISREIAAMVKNQPDLSRDIENKRQELLVFKNEHSQTVSRILRHCEDLLVKYRKVHAMFEETQRTAQEKKTAGERAKGRVRTACFGRLPTDYTFNTSSLNEEKDENCRPDENFTVFK